MRRERGAALLVLLTVLFTIMAAAAVAALRPLARQHAAQSAQQQSLALARDALRGAALVQRCAERYGVLVKAWRDSRGTT